MSVKSAHTARFVAAGVVAALAVATAAPAGAAAPTGEPGVSKSEIVIGTTTPLTGPASPGYKYVAPAAQAYFDYVNANGGINGRKIKFVVADDAYNPALTKKVTNQLILRDKIFAMFGALGTPSHSAVVTDLNRRGIPDVFVNTGFSGFDNASRYPTTFPYFPSYTVEAKSMAFYIQRDAALNAKTKCLFYQDGEFGDNAMAGFNAAGMTFAATTSYSSGQQVAPFTAQVTKLKAAGCDLVVFFGVTSATAQLLGTAAKAGFRPTWMLTSVGSDPSVLGASLGAATNVAYVFAQALKAAGPDLTRASLINALQTKANTFRSAAVVPMVINSKSHQGLTGYWMGQYNASGQLERKTSYIITATSATTGGAKQSRFSAPAPTPKLLP